MQARKRAVARLIAIISTPGWCAPKARASDGIEENPKQDTSVESHPWRRTSGMGKRAISITSSVSQNVPDEMSKEKHSSNPRMPQTQKRKCSVNLGELISFLSMSAEYSLTLH